MSERRSSLGDDCLDWRNGAENDDRYFLLSLAQSRKSVKLLLSVSGSMSPVSASGSGSFGQGCVWHGTAPQQVLAQLRSRASGLSEAEARERLAEVGANALPQAPPPGIAAILWRQLRSPLIAILAVAAALSLAIGDGGDAGFIAAVLLINALVGGWQEWQAERQTRALQQLLSPRAVVQRDGVIAEIDAQAVVPGDVVWVESGQRVPADLRLLHTHNLEVDESLLTGESLTVLKDAHWLGAAATPLAERRNMLFTGSTVVRGRGRGLAVATGTATAVGQLALDMLATDEGQPPLVSRMARFSRVIAVAVLLAATAVVLLGVLVKGQDPVAMVFFAIALAVSAIPEGLPVVLTVALAVATRRMARRGVIVRRLPAVEGLGSCTLIASDKTGTLTCNALTVRRLLVPTGEEFTVSGEGFMPTGEVLQDGLPVPTAPERFGRLARAAVLCNEADLYPLKDGLPLGTRWSWHGDPTEIALLTFARKLGWSRELAADRYPRINEIPFEPEHRFSASFHAIEGRVRVVVKGAPERVLPMCLPDPACPPPAALAQRLAAQGCRVLALAEGPAPPDLQSTAAPPEPVGLTLLGLVGMIDPLRPGVTEAVAACHRAGITVWMVTGDHPDTARSIACELGLADEGTAVVTGADLEGRSPEALRPLLATTNVFARMAPHQKLQLVQAARQAGHCVAVTGDGVNDAPALRAAHIGVAMGRGGTDVAREAAELVIADDNFATIVAGVEEGRIAYANVRKVIYLLVSTGAAEIVLIALTLLAGLPLPLLPVQLLWLNLVTNGIQDVALAFEPGEGDLLRRRPRAPGEPIFDGLMVQRTLLAAALMGGVAFACFALLLEQGWSLPQSRNAVLLLMVLFENVHIGNCRSETRSVFQLSPLGSPVLLAGTLAALGLHLLMMQLPLGRDLLETAPLEPGLGLRLFGLSLTVLLPIELHKLLRRLRHGRRRRRQLRPAA